MVDDRRRGEAAVGAAHLRRDVRMGLGQALDVGLVDDGVFPGDLWPQFAQAPVEDLVDDDGLRHAAGIVAPIERQIFALAPRAVAEMRVAPHHPAGDPLGVGVEQQLVRIEAMAVVRLIRTVHAIAVKLSRRNVVEIAVPDVLGSFRQRDAFELAPALAVEQAEFDAGGVGRKQREIRAPPIPCCAQAMGGPRSQSHHQSSSTRNIVASGGIVSLSSGTSVAEVSTTPPLPTLLPP